jgi:hypothetical protein
MADLDFSQQVSNTSMPPSEGLRVVPAFSQLIFPLCPSKDIDGLEVVGRGQPFSSVSVEDCTIFEKSQESSSEDKE